MGHGNGHFQQKTDEKRTESELNYHENLIPGKSNGPTFGNSVEN